MFWRKYACTFVVGIMSSSESSSTSPSKSIGDLIDEALGIKGPEDLLRLVLVGVGIAVLVVFFFIARSEKYSIEWWSLVGFEILAGLLCATTVYVVHILLPSISMENTKSD